MVQKGFLAIWKFGVRFAVAKCLEAPINKRLKRKLLIKCDCLGMKIESTGCNNIESIAISSEVLS